MYPHKAKARDQPGPFVVFSKYTEKEANFWIFFFWYLFGPIK